MGIGNSRWQVKCSTVGPDSELIITRAQVVAGQANLYIDAELVVDNTTEQELGTYFLAQGSVEEVSGRLRSRFGSSRLYGCPFVERHSSRHES